MSEDTKRFDDTAVLGGLYSNPELSPEALEQELKDIEALEAEQAQTLIDAADAAALASEVKADNPLAEAQQHDYEKRYKDLQRFMSKKDKEHEAQLSALRGQLEEQDVSLPKSAEELQAFRDNYPDMYATIETVASLKTSESATELSNRLALVERREQEVEKKDALILVKKAHEDLEDVVGSSEFTDWINAKTEAGSTWVRDAAFDSVTAQPVIDVISLYKREKGIGEPRKRGRPRKDSDPSAGATKVSTGKSEEPGAGRETVYTEADIQKMTDEEFTELDAAGAFRATV